MRIGLSTFKSLQSESLRGEMEKLSRRLQLAKSLDTKNPLPTESLMTREFLELLV